MIELYLFAVFVVSVVAGAAGLGMLLNGGGRRAAVSRAVGAERRVRRRVSRGTDTRHAARRASI